MWTIITLTLFIRGRIRRVWTIITLTLFIRGRIRRVWTLIKFAIVQVAPIFVQ